MLTQEVSFEECHKTGTDISNCHAIRSICTNAQCGRLQAIGDAAGSARRQFGLRELDDAVLDFSSPKPRYAQRGTRRLHQLHWVFPRG